MNLPIDNNLDIRLFEAMLDDSNFTNSYKILWIKAIFKEIIIGNNKIELKKLSCRMISIAWYPLVQYKLNFGLQDQIIKIIEYIKIKFNIKCDENEDVIVETLYNSTDEKLELYLKQIIRYVPYRLLTPFYSNEIKGKKDGIKNRLILEYSKQDFNVFYRIYNNESIIINDKWFKYIYNNQAIIKGWIDYKLIYYLQKKNPNVPAIPFKLCVSKKRELNNAKKFWSIVNEKNTIIDIYINKPLNKENYNLYGGFSIDHFIPWSFVLHDELWNLVPTFKKVNSSKSNLLPDIEQYLDAFCNMQYNAFNIIRKEEKMRRYLEEYININIPLVLNPLNKEYKEITEEIFIAKIKDNILPLHQIAYNQGYTIWDGYNQI